MNNQDEAMWIDYDYHMNTGELSDYFDTPPLDNEEQHAINVPLPPTNESLTFSVNDNDVLDKLDNIIKRLEQQIEDNRG